MGDAASELGEVERLSRLLRERPRLLVERWERLVQGEAATLHDRAPALVARIAAQLGRAARGAADQDAADPRPPAGVEGASAADLSADLGALVHLRTALFELCAAEGVRLEGEAAHVVHAALDDAVAAAAGAMACGAIAAARQERERLDLTLQLLPVGVFIADAEGRLLAINDAAMRIWGAQAPLVESAAAYGVYRAYRPGASEPIAPEEWGLSRALRGEDPPDDEFEIVSFGGQRRTIVNCARALRGPDGAVTGGVAVNVDVTERKRSELRLAAIIEGALDAIVLIDESGRVTEFNAAAERTFGYTRAQAIGRELAELVIEPGLREAHRRGLRRYLATGESNIVGRRVEMRAMRADGTLFDVELTVIRLPTGSPAVFAGFLRDITDRRQAERERAREAEFRERFIGILGHDLRTPLSAILLAAHKLLRKEALAEAEARALERITRSAGRMERMIHDLLDFARTRHGGGIPVAPEDADLSAICRHVLDEVGLTHPARAVELRCCRDAAGRWDPDRIAQVVQNLVVNALDYSPAHTPVRVAIADAGERVVLSVTNDGPPIPPEMLPDLFDPFRRRARGAHERAAKGLGLGLYIAHEIVRAHHGRMSVESDEGAGTTFAVELPRAQAR
jgi:PAS domain S-box-containing protein